jgi:iron complex transport system substrate-binding protein
LISRRVFFLLPLLLLTACRREQEGGPSASAPPPARRIVVLTPSLTETLFALGLGDRVVGVGDYTDWPPEAVRKPHLGGLFNFNLERIVSLRPDLAVLGSFERDLAAKLRPLKVDVLIVPNETLADVEHSFQAISRRCGVPAAGDRLAAEWRAGLVPNPLPGPPLKVLLSVGRPPGRLGDITVAGHDTFLDELLGRMGAVNAFADSPTRYPQIGAEEIVARKPDVVLELRSDPQTPEQAAAIVRDWQALPQVPAVRDHAVAVVAGSFVLLPGPRLPQLYREMRAALLRTRGRQVALPPGIEIPGYPRSPLPGAQSRAGRQSVARDFNPGRDPGRARRPA